MGVNYSVFCLPLLAFPTRAAVIWQATELCRAMASALCSCRTRCHLDQRGMEEYRSSRRTMPRTEPALCTSSVGAHALTASPLASRARCRAPTCDDCVRGQIANTAQSTKNGEVLVSAIQAFLQGSKGTAETPAFAGPGARLRGHASSSRVRLAHLAPTCAQLALHEA